MLLQGRCNVVTRALQRLYKGFTRVLQGYYKGVTSASSMFQTCYKSLTLTQTWKNAGPTWKFLDICGNFLHEWNKMDVFNEIKIRPLLHLK